MTTYTMQGRVVPDAERLAKIERLAHLMDESIPLPGTGKRIGLEALLGLIPGLGTSRPRWFRCISFPKQGNWACQKRSCRR